ncbi:AAA family ATPase [Desulforamulus ferrireducens]|uniref:AAA family ATPase n=1 Tax=Desulforamulus ferrireducens TaxID=1833852 RepID=A0A1S6ITG5_9FIRM|nr:AAA family ATPase [Desulforamulus ferrireducens]AQS58064.1 AAA family ATPase [Desulforamulus ferrireducens]
MAFLKEVRFNWSRVEEEGSYPFNIPALRNMQSISMDRNVVFLVGENGTGKSTFLEALAKSCGFSTISGGRNHPLVDHRGDFSLADIITLSWLPKVEKGFFLRAESFFNFANYLDDLAEEYGGSVYLPYGGKSLLRQSHGESFLSLFNNSFFRKGIYLLDEPEAALSPQRQLAFLRIIWELESTGNAQFIIATHSPILLAYPNSIIYSFADEGIKQMTYQETEHYQLTRDFLNNPGLFLNKLLQ